MNNNINIAEILRDCPRGTKLYSPIYGEVELNKVLDSGDIFVYLDAGQYLADRIKSFMSDGKFAKGGECQLFPSREERDWSKFKPQPECPFKPFDRVLVRDYDNDIWEIAFFAIKSPGCCYKVIAADNPDFIQCIPYEGNERLLGTSDPYTEKGGAE